MKLSWVSECVNEAPGNVHGTQADYRHRGLPVCRQVFFASAGQLGVAFDYRHVAPKEQIASQILIEQVGGARGGH